MIPPGMIPGGPPAGGGHADPGVVDAILRRMHGGAPGPGGPPGAGPDSGSPPGGHDPNIGPLDAVQSVVQDLHKLMEILHDPQGVNTAATCLKAMTQLQHQMMSQGGGK